MRQPDLTVLAERLHKPRNFSAVIRTCDAVGIGEVHAVPVDGKIDKHWHTSQGAVKWVRIKSHESPAAAIELLKQQGHQLVAAHLSDRAVDYREVDYSCPTALVIGTEAFGISNESLASVDHEIMIPMLGLSQSLNVSVACAVVLYEAQRQRQLAGLYDKRRISDAEYSRLRFEWMHPEVADWCRRHGKDYPALDEAGDLAEPLPRD
jgi:tRNA (guanosine-2'-O-)-methyltransferase